MSCAARDELIGELVRAVEDLRAEVADLRRRLGRNSGNSSMPPSTDDLPGKVAPGREARGKGRQVAAGFGLSRLAKAACVVADVVKLIKTLITAAYVAGFDETTLRCGPAGSKKYVLAAVTERHSLFFLGARTLESFRDFGVLPAFGGVVVSDRYANYFHNGWEHIAGHQACLAHLIRDYQDAAECYPGAVWPVQAP